MVEANVLPDMIAAWEPPSKRHCATCIHARVRGEPSAPTAYCERLFGDDVPLVRLIRPSQARGFREARTCPHFDSSA